MQVVCFGVGKLNLTFPHNSTAQSWSRLSRHRMSNITSEQVAKFLGEVRWGFDALVDCRPFHDPESMRHSRHIGSHPDIMNGLLRQEGHLRKCLRTVKKAFMRNLQSPTPLPEVYIGVFCNAGTHRSVAFAMTIMGILRDLGCNVEDTRFWSRDYWYDRKCQDMGRPCPDCNGRQKDRDAVIAKVARMYDEESPFHASR